VHNVPEPHIVAKGHNVLDFPEEAASVPVVVISQRYELNASDGIVLLLVTRELKKLLHVRVEPRLPVEPDAVDNAFRLWSWRVDAVTSHEYPVICGVHQSLDKVRVGIGGFGKGLDSRRLVADRVIPGDVEGASIRLVSV
jgi:hypothetical protein